MVVLHPFIHSNQSGLRLRNVIKAFITLFVKNKMLKAGKAFGAFDGSAFDLQECNCRQ